MTHSVTLLTLALAFAGCLRPYLADEVQDDDEYCDMFGWNAVKDSMRNPAATLDVYLVDGATGAPVEGLCVVAIQAHLDPNDVEDHSLGVNPCFDECVYGRTDSDGAVSFGLPDGLFHIVHPSGYFMDHGPDGYTGELLPWVAAHDQGTATLEVFPETVEWQWTGSIHNVDPAGLSSVEVRHTIENIALLRRMDRHSLEVSVTWANYQTSYADLYPGLALPGNVRFSDDYANDVQGPDSGQVTEELHAPWSYFDDDGNDDTCVVVQDGLDVIVYDPGPAFNSPGNVTSFVIDFKVDLDGFVEFLSDGIDTMEDCGLQRFPSEPPGTQ